MANTLAYSGEDLNEALKTLIVPAFRYLYFKTLTTVIDLVF